jgi:hypothetical protein
MKIRERFMAIKTSSKYWELMYDRFSKRWYIVHNTLKCYNNITIVEKHIPFKCNNFPCNSRIPKAVRALAKAKMNMSKVTI